MNFLLDENFPKSAGVLLEEKGHKVFDYRGTSEEGADDFRLFEIAQNNEAVILTTDRDFYHTVPILYKHHFGVIVVALKQPNRKAITDRLEWLLDQIEIFPLNDKVIQLRDNSCRVRNQIDSSGN
ncbi:MAG: DUF5615 family PIN-like protein [Planctomycetota bacterium]|jgi:predicted nuclease of predicted toxin-antitoxin system